MDKKHVHYDSGQELVKKSKCLSQLHKNGYVVIPVGTRTYNTDLNQKLYIIEGIYLSLLMEYLSISRYTI